MRITASKKLVQQRVGDDRCFAACHARVPSFPSSWPTHEIPDRPADSAHEALQLLARRCPCFALLDANLPADGLGPLTDSLVQLEVPFAVLATGLEEHFALYRLPVLRAAPRLIKPFNPWNLHRTASVLHQISLRSKLAAADRRIKEGQARLTQQIRLIERLESTGTHTTLANSLLHEIARTLRIMRASRSILRQQLDSYDALEAVFRRSVGSSAPS